ncbi:oxidoreductase [Streptomyces triticagri]|uniref:Oxidoreductase n=1 Tax=Streptomyces triticagri TaxID=2293568 RepID=A0A372M0F8_9ACTN|nr:PmoA family protein [Streptomyces triticagri]RFU84382.1 oxidoreductase [Streptomyces triticagri]
MTTPLSIVHTVGDRLTVRAGDTEILSYVYRPDPDPYEARKPYIHPLRTLAGRLASGYRPNDHRWHKGLQMTASHLSGQNFWGGVSYLGPEQGYQRLPERVGAMRHDGFDAVQATGERVVLASHLTWVENGGAEWARERRGITVHSVDPDAGAYAVDWSIHLTNTRADAGPLRFGSPTTAGREMAGYTGLQWRGPRDFTGGQVLTPAGPATDEETMGAAATEADWVGFTAEHDDVDAHSTLLFAHAPENLGPDAVHASHWFVRSTPIPSVAFSWAFFEEFELPAGESFAYRYRVVVADGAWDHERAATHLNGLPW